MRAEQLERQIQGAEQERDQWEHKYEEAQRGTRPRSASWTRLSNKWKVFKYAEWHVGEDPRTVFSFGSLVKLFVSTLFLSRVARASVELFVTEHESIMQVVIFLLSHSTQLDLALEVLAQSVELCA